MGLDRPLNKRRMCKNEWVPEYPDNLLKDKEELSETMICSIQVVEWVTSCPRAVSVSDGGRETVKVERNKLHGSNSTGMYRWAILNPLLYSQSFPSERIGAMLLCLRACKSCSGGSTVHVCCEFLVLLPWWQMYINTNFEKKDQGTSLFKFQGNRSKKHSHRVSVSV